MKTSKRILSIVLSVAMLVTSIVIVSANTTAEITVDTEFKPTYKVAESFNEKPAITYYASNGTTVVTTTTDEETTVVPDGNGLSMKTSAGAIVAEIPLEEEVFVNGTMAQNGAVMFYYGSNRTPGETFEKIAVSFYVKNGDAEEKQMGLISGAIYDRRWYSISAVTGQVKAFSSHWKWCEKDPYSSDFDPLGLKDFNSGYITIPLAGFFGNTTDSFKQRTDISLDNLQITKVKIEIYGINRGTPHPVQNSEFYIDNIGFTDNMENILGKRGETATGNDSRKYTKYEYDGGDLYPVYAFTTLPEGELYVPQTEKIGDGVLVTGLPENAIANLYNENGYVKSAIGENGIATFTSLPSGNYKVQYVIPTTNGYTASKIAVVENTEFKPTYEVAENFADEPSLGARTEEVSYELTNNSPDGAGFVLSSWSTRFHPQLNLNFEESITITSDMAEKGAIIFYYGKDKIDTNGFERLQVGLRGTYGNETSLSTGTDPLYPSKPKYDNRWYTISDKDGSVSAYSSAGSWSNVVNGANDNLGMNDFNSGYIAIPLAAFFGAETGSDYTTQYVPNSKVGTGGITITGIRIWINSDNGADINRDFFIDNIGFTDNMANILGAKVEGSTVTTYTEYQYDGGDTYPVYKLSAMNSNSTDKSPEFTKDESKVTVSYTCESDWIANLYVDDEYVESKLVKQGEDAVFENIKNGKVAVQAFEFDSNGEKLYSKVARDFTAKENALIADATDAVKNNKVNDAQAIYDTITMNGMDKVIDEAEIGNKQILVALKEVFERYTAKGITEAQGEVGFTAVLPTERIADYEIVEYGVVMLPTDMFKVCANRLQYGNYNALTAGIKITDDHENSTNNYSVALEDLEGKSNIKISARTYVVYSSKDNKSQITVYGTEVCEVTTPAAQ